MPYLTRPISTVGQWGLDLLEFLGGVGLILVDATRLTHVALFTSRGRRLGWQNLWSQMVRVGVRSIPIVSLVLFCIGAILSLQMAPILNRFGLITTVPDIISISIFRELGPLVSAIVLTGFAGASIAAEMGSMVVSEEIEALEAEAIDPVRFLVVPRIVATTIMLIFIAVTGDIMGIVGGLSVSYFSLGIGFRQYIQHTFSTVEVLDFVTGLVKAGCFGALISAIACHLGLGVKGGAQGVGEATTRTVVYTIVALITVDLVFTAVFYALGW